MRMLFVCGAGVGGAPRSTIDLAVGLAGREHVVDVLIGRPGRTRAAHVYKRAVDLSTSLERRRVPTRPVLALQRRIGARPTPADPDALGGRDLPGVGVFRSDVPENAARTMLRRDRPEVMIASSLERVAWRRLLFECRTAGIPAVLYLRAVSDVGHLAFSGLPPDRLLSNTRSVADQTAALGYPATFIPSLVDLAAARKAVTQTPATRTTVLLVNPVESHGVRIALELAARRPDIPFVLQESWVVTDAERQALGEQLGRLENVTLRAPVASAAEVFAGARVLLAPHRIDNRPRVILEAQANAIPVIASAQPGLLDQLGPGGISVAVDATTDQWEHALASLWDDPQHYDELSRRALAHAERPEQAPEAILTAFETAMTETIAAGPR